MASRLSLTIAAILAMIGAADAAVLRFRSQAEARSPIVRLGDVADIADAEPRESEALAQVSIGPAPAPGSEVRIDVASVRSRLAAQGVNLARTELTGSSVIVVTAAGGVRPAATREVPERMLQSQHERAERQVTQAVSRYLQRLAPELAKAHVSVTIDRNDVPTLLAGAAGGYEIRGGSAPWDAPQTLTVRMLDRDNAIREAMVACRILPRPFVLAVKHTVPKGHVLQAGDLAMRQSESPEGAFLRTEDVVGRETQRSIRQDEVIRPADVRSVPLVRSNDIVTVTARSGGIVVKRPMKAKSDGAPGETVTLVALSGRETVVARVTGYHEAEVVAGGASADATPDDGRIRFVNDEPPRRRGLAANPAGLVPVGK